MSDSCRLCTVAEDNPYFLFESRHWRVTLRAKYQSYFGRCTVFSKRHCGSVSALTNDEWLDFKRVIDIMEHVFQRSFGASPFTWLVQMNGAYRVNPPTPHVHYHFIPRYKEPVQFMGAEFPDTEYGETHATGKYLSLPEAIEEELLSTLKGELLAEAQHKLP